MLYTNALVTVKIKKMSYHNSFQAPYRSKYHTRYQKVTLQCQQCMSFFVAYPKTFAQAKNPHQWRKYCHPCFQEFQRREREAKEKRYAELVAKQIAAENVARITREAREAEEAEETAEAKEREDVMIAQMRVDFFANPDDFFRRFLWLSVKVDELSEKVDELSEKVDELS